MSLFIFIDAKNLDVGAVIGWLFHLAVIFPYVCSQFAAMCEGWLSMLIRTFSVAA